jgi:hypothetical protein
MLVLDLRLGLRLLVVANLPKAVPDVLRLAVNVRPLPKPADLRLFAVTLEVFLRLAVLGDFLAFDMLKVLRLVVVDVRPFALVDLRLATGDFEPFANVELRRRRAVAVILLLTPVERRDFAAVDFVPARETRLLVPLTRVPRIEALLLETGFLEIFLLVVVELRVVDFLPLAIAFPPLRLILHVKYRIYLNFFIFV